MVVTMPTNFSIVISITLNFKCLEIELVPLNKNIAECSTIYITYNVTKVFVKLYYLFLFVNIIIRAVAFTFSMDSVLFQLN